MKNFRYVWITHGELERLLLDRLLELDVVLVSDVQGHLQLGDLHLHLLLDPLHLRLQLDLCLGQASVEHLDLDRHLLPAIQKEIYVCAREDQRLIYQENKPTPASETQRETTID